jgi:hypothetical protein
MNSNRSANDLAGQLTVIIFVHYENLSSVYSVPLW